MRFSLIYIALAFSAMQFAGLNVDDVIRWIERADLLGRVPLLAVSPLLAILISVGIAFVLSWLAGLLVTVVRYHGFTLTADHRRLYTERGLGGRFERAIPQKKVQAVLYATNPLMRHFGYASLEAQTMGLDNRGAGREVLIPLAKKDVASALGKRLLGQPVTDALRPVSRRFIRRRGLRYSALLGIGVASGALVWPPAIWLLVLLPLAWGLAWAQWRAHGFAFDGRTLVVQHGALRRRQWHLPLEKFQTVEHWANLFQRRHGLASVYVDTAGAPDIRGPVIEDLPAGEASALANTLYAAFDLLGNAAGPLRAADHTEQSAAQRSRDHPAGVL
jgi:putative membrane protein